MENSRGGGWWVGVQLCGIFGCKVIQSSLKDRILTEKGSGIRFYSSHGLG